MATREGKVMHRILNLDDAIDFNMYPSYEEILDSLSEDLCFTYTDVARKADGKSKYRLSDICYVTKDFVNYFIEHGTINNSVNRAKILYDLYACRWLVITDLKYPTYLDWKYKHSDMSIDHILPKKYFPLLTFDCSNWQPLSIEENKDKGTEFAKEGKEVVNRIKVELQVDFYDAYSSIKG